MSTWQKAYDFFMEDGYHMMADDRMLDEVKLYFDTHSDEEWRFINWCAKRYANDKDADYGEEVYERSLNRHY